MEPLCWCCSTNLNSHVCPGPLYLKSIHTVHGSMCNSLMTKWTSALTIYTLLSWHYRMKSKIGLYFGTMCSEHNPQFPTMPWNYLYNFNHLILKTTLKKYLGVCHRGPKERTTSLIMLQIMCLEVAQSAYTILMTKRYIRNDSDSMTKWKLVKPWLSFYFLTSRYWFLWFKNQVLESGIEF